LAGRRLRKAPSGFGSLDNGVWIWKREGDVRGGKKDMFES